MKLTPSERARAARYLRGFANAAKTQAAILRLDGLAGAAVAAAALDRQADDARLLATKIETEVA